MADIQGPAGIPGKGPAPRVEPGRGRAVPSSPGGKPSDFAGLLEKLRRLGQEARAADLTPGKKEKDLDPAALAKRLEEAERTFRKAMEVRRSLEAAWRAAGRKSYPAGGEPGKEGNP